MSTYTLSGTGIQALSSSVVALHVSIVTLPSEPGHGVANPVDYYGVGFIRPGDASSFWEPMPINGGPQWMPVPNGSTRIGYALQGVSSITVAEVFGTGPLSFPLASLPDVAVATPTNAQVLTYDSTLAKWKNAAAAGGGGGGALANQSAVLASTVNLPTTFAWVDVLTLSLVAGTWLIQSHLQFRGNGSVVASYGKLYVSGGVEFAGGSGREAYVHTVRLHAIAVLASTTTVRLAATTNSGGNLTVAASLSFDLPTSNVATRLDAVQIAP